MFAFFMFFSLLLGGVLQAVLPIAPRLGQAPVPILLSIALFHALDHNRDAAVAAAFFAGIVQDSLGWTPFGTSSCAFCLAVWYVHHARQHWLDTGVWAEAMVGAGAAAFFAVLSFALLLAREDMTLSPAGVVALKTAGSALLGAFATPLVCRLMRKMDRALGTAPKQEGMRLATKS